MQGRFESEIHENIDILVVKLVVSSPGGARLASIKCSHRWLSGDLASQINGIIVVERACIRTGDSVDSVAFEVIYDRLQV